MDFHYSNLEFACGATLDKVGLVLVGVVTVKYHAHALRYRLLIGTIMIISHNSLDVMHSCQRVIALYFLVCPREWTFIWTRL